MFNKTPLFIRYYNAGAKISYFYSLNVVIPYHFVNVNHFLIIYIHMMNFTIGYKKNAPEKNSEAFV